MPFTALPTKAKWHNQGMYPAMKDQVKSVGTEREELLLFTKKNEVMWSAERCLHLEISHQTDGWPSLKMTAIWCLSLRSFALINT